MAYVPLHTHTEHSALDGMAKLETLCQRGADLGMTAMSSNDHGSLDGLWKFVKNAKEAGIKPIPGMEAYMAIGSRFERNEIILPRDDDEGMSDADDEDDESEDIGTDGSSIKTKTKTKRYGHLTLLARNRAGWHNLIRFHNKSQESYWYKARGDMELLAECGEGLIVLTGCLAGPVAGPLSRVEAALDAGDEELALSLRQEARDAVDQMIDAVGRDYVFLEIMDHGIAAEDRAMEEIIALAEETGLTMVATNDSHYQDEEDAHGHDGFLCVGTGSQLDQPKRFRFNGSGYWLKSEQEMLAVRPDDDVWIQAVYDTQLVADLVDDDTAPGPEMLLPQFPVPVGFNDSVEYLLHLVEQGVEDRYKGRLTDEVWDRIDSELSIINKMGFADYFLVTWDFLSWCASDAPVEFDNPDAPRKKKIILGLGRGSAAGSAVSYALGIVGVDPLMYGLLFERFLEPGRMGMPDIDMDIPASRRTEAFAYLIYRWGREYCARIGSYGVAKTKQALQDAARILKPHVPKKATEGEKKRLMSVGTEYTKIGETLSGLVPQTGEKPYSFEKLDNPKDKMADGFWAAAEKAGSKADEILRLARSFEDTAKSPGIHPCGFVVSPIPLESLVPLRRASYAKNADPDAPLIIGWDGADCEEIGLLKMDILGLMNLDIASVALDYIEETTGERIEFTDLPAPETEGSDVDAAWSLLAHGRTEGIFQSESPGMTRIIQAFKPRSLEDMSVAVATYRPGPIAAGVPDHYAARKSGDEPIDYFQFTDDPAEQKQIATILDATQGLFIYQEQLMQLGTVIAGFDASQRSVLRKAVGKKDAVKMKQVGDLLAAGAPKEFRDESGSLISQVFAPETAKRTFDLMKGSAEYLFNKAHSAAYGYLAYLTAYMKANWPVEYGAAILAVADKAEKRRPALASLARDGIEVRTPSVNRSRAVTAPDGEVVVLGLGEIKDVGSVAVHIVAEREANGPFTSVHQMIARVKVPTQDPARMGRINTQALHAMAEAGALDEFGPRMGLAQIVRGSESHDLPVPEVDWDIVDRAARQRNRLGVHLGEPVLPLIQDILDAWRTPDDKRDGGQPAKRLAFLEEKERSPKLFSILTRWEERNSRNGRMANATLEDGETIIEAVIFPDAFKTVARSGYKPAVGDVVCVSGTIRTRTIDVGDEDTPELMTINELAGSRMWRVHVPETTPNEELFPEVGFAELYEGFGPGGTQVSEQPDAPSTPTRERKSAAAQEPASDPEPAARPEPEEIVVVVTTTGAGVITPRAESKCSRVLIGEVPEGWKFDASGTPLRSSEVARYPKAGGKGVVLMYLDRDLLPEDLTPLLALGAEAIEAFGDDSRWKISNDGAGLLHSSKLAVIADEDPVAAEAEAEPDVETPVLAIHHADDSVEIISGQMTQGWTPDYCGAEIFNGDVVRLLAAGREVLIAIVAAETPIADVRQLLDRAAQNAVEWIQDDASTGSGVLFFAPEQELVDA